MARDNHDTATLDLHTGGLLFGYARVSTDGQELQSQRKALEAAGCTRIFAEKVSGASRNREQLEKLIDHLRQGDTLVVTRLDRLARSTRDLIDVVERLRTVGAHIKSLAEPWADTGSPAGKMVLTVFAGVAEFERSLILSRTNSGRIAAKERGVRFGRTPSLTEQQIEHARDLTENHQKSMREVADLLGVHRTTLYRAMLNRRTTGKMSK